MVVDHTALAYLKQGRNSSAKLTRWALRLEEFDYEPVYRPGIKHTNVDALSRLPAAETHMVLMVDGMARAARSRRQEGRRLDARHRARRPVRRAGRRLGQATRHPARRAGRRQAALGVRGRHPQMMRARSRRTAQDQRTQSYRRRLRRCQSLARSRG